MCKSTAVTSQIPRYVPHKAHLGCLMSLVAHQIPSIATIWNSLAGQYKRNTKEMRNQLHVCSGVVHASMLTGHGPDTDPLCV